MKQDLKIAIVGSAGVPGRYGGFETLAHHLVLQLNKHNDITVYCDGTLYKKPERKKIWNNARLIFLPFKANGLQSIIYDYISILHALTYADRVLILGVSGCTILPLIKLFSRKKIIVNIDGLEWRRSKWSKPVKWFLKFSEWCAVKFSDADVTDNAAIQRYTAIRYNTCSHNIAYGSDHCIRQSIDGELFPKYPFLTGKYAFKVARIEPENNIHIILEAFQSFAQYPLVVVGNWNHSEYGRKLKSQFGNCTNIVLLDSIYDQKILDMIRSNAHVYLHGHSAGGTNPSLVEAMYLELPIFAFNVSYNRETTDNKARYFSNSEELKKLLEVTTDVELNQLRTEMYSVAKKLYQWKMIASRYQFVFNVLEKRFEKRDVFPAFQIAGDQMLQRLGAMHLSLNHRLTENR